ncbi:MAG: transporter [Isosphaeraceae bacterium]
MSRLARGAPRLKALRRTRGILLLGLAWCPLAWAQSPDRATPEETRRALADLVESAADSAPDAASPLPWLDVIGRSALGQVDPRDWRPLGLGNLLEGWDEPYAPAPVDDGIPPRQTWINSTDGPFFRLFAFYFAYLGGLPHDRTSYQGQLFVFTPLSRRVEVGWFLPFAEATPNLLNPGGIPYTTRVGDLTIEPRILLAEDRRYSVSTNLYVRLPTGSIRNGQGVASLSPDIEFWTNPIPNWVIRGAAGLTIPTNETAAREPYLDLSPFSGFNTTPGPFSSFNVRLAIGKYLTPPDARIFPNFVTYVSSNFHTEISGGNTTFLSLTPGVRFGLGNRWYFLGGLDVPVVGPLPFHAEAIFLLVKNY